MAAIPIRLLSTSMCLVVIVTTVAICLTVTETTHRAVVDSGTAITDSSLQSCFDLTVRRKTSTALTVS